MSAYYLIPTISFEGLKVSAVQEHGESVASDLVKDVGTSRSCAGLCGESPSPFAEVFRP
jgi:hypothetical protein